MDSRTGSPTSNTDHETPADQEETVERSSIRDISGNESQNNERTDGSSAVNSVHGRAESLGAISPTGPESGDEATTSDEEVASLGVSQSREQNTDDGNGDGSAGDRLSENSDEGEAYRHELDDDIMEAIIGAAAETGNDANSDQYTVSSGYPSGYLTELSESSSDDGRHGDANPGTASRTTNVVQLLEHPPSGDLWEAISDHQIERVEELLAGDPELSNSKALVEHDDEGQEPFVTPLYLAVVYRQPRIVEALLKYGADVDAFSTHIAGGISALHSAAIMADYTSVRLLLSQGATIDIQRASGITPLHDAITRQKVDIVQCLLEEGADPTLRDNELNSAFHLAAQFDSVEILDLLWAATADPETQIAEVNALRSTLLHIASGNNCSNVVKWLLDKGADPSLRDGAQNSAFHLAAQFDSVKILDLLWAATADPETQITEKNASDNAPLHTASANDCPEVVRWLLDRGANVDQVGEYQRTPLHMASIEGNDGIVLILLKNRAQIDPLDSDSQTPLLLACANLQGEVMKTLFYHCASTTTVDSSGRGCLHHVVQGHDQLGEGSKSFPEYLEYLAGRGAVVDQEDHHGSTPLMDACQGQNPELIQTLLDLGADINRKGHMGWTPIFYACKKPDNGSLDLLLRRGADVTVTMTGEYTPLHAVCSWGIISNVRLLLKYNAPVTALDGDGNTPLLKAADNKAVDIMLELIKTREYFPNNPVTDPAFIEPPKSAAKIVGVFLNSFDVEARGYSERDLESLLHWAVSHGRFELIQKCLRYRRKALFWRTGGEATWLHVAAQYGHSGIINNLFSKIDAAKEASGGITALNVATAHGHLDTARALLEIIARDSPNADEASCAKARAIIHWNGRRESPLTLSISRKHKDLEKLFFSELKALGEVSGTTLDSIKESELLEILAEWEKPGRESLLKHLLQHWLPAPSNTDVRYWSALHWAVHGSAAVVVWWLLSKGGYRSGDAIRDCQKDPLVKADAIGQIIQNLLRNPPPQMYEIANPVDDERPFPPRPMDWENQRPDLHGFVMTVYSQNGKTVVPYTRDTLHGIIYSQGPTALSRRVEMLEQRDLNILKKKLGNVLSDDQSLPNIWNQSRTPSGGVRSTITHRRLRHDFSGSSENLKLRWIHLPVNELQLTKDLVTRLSHDSGRSEMDHRNFMKFFNRSWTELAAGARQHYMKPLCLRAQIDERGKFRTCTAVYMPYLTLGEYDPKNPKKRTLSGLKESGDDNLISRRDSRHIAHVPLTLDQYYYPGISDTSYRDKTQVFSKYLEEHHEKVVSSTSRSKKKQILMVDQLWIWIIDDQSVITSTSQRQEESSTVSSQDARDSSMSTLLQHVLNDIAYGETRGRSERPTSVNEVMQLALGAATGFFIEKCVQLADGTFKGPLEVFRESIRDVANRETELFQNFLKDLKQEIEKRKARTERISSRSGRPSIRELPNNPHYIISEETELLDQIRDINDELHMLRSLAEDQEIVWKQAFADMETQGRFSCTPTEIARDLDGMILEAEMTRDSIDTLLDLRQKQASLAETEAGRLQANDTARQSNNIYVFTLVTIFFLPLSWLTSLFALNIASFPHNGGTIEYQPQWLFPILCGDLPPNLKKTRANIVHESRCDERVFQYSHFRPVEG
ncbi:hypothetical protein IFM58399_09785 [Aspergillus lentulus]|uniref:uncharacterized protein n=1 Tax=Aspergillus lentulus TaxID=293939 RepID=UPI0013926B7C|nr:uncharacterized protein IFM58399_09785 [Aspergillus lentulus]KAF4171263.1 hypothetical protein CNMCM8060_003449 [Aspergillus lentulus]KAF4185110.1 hypothetical protein CNMCM7927_007135 [Aspergillus lentulus]KAF4191582.1 hypothetical protein CNMCM8694_001685 [Aspergillus lentulus]GFF54269.1 hypothetical protein IFM58399_09785 [Aspergillus lentulus]